VQRCKLAHGAVIVCDMREQPGHLKHRAEFHEHLGEEDVCVSIEKALERTRFLRESAASA